MAFVSHMQRLGDDRTQLHTAELLQGCIHRRTENRFHPFEPGQHRYIVGSKAQNLSQTFIQVAEGDIAAVLVVHDPDRHGGADHTRHRADSAKVMAR